MPYSVVPRVLCGKGSFLFPGVDFSIDNQQS